MSWNNIGGVGALVVHTRTFGELLDGRRPPITWEPFPSISCQMKGKCHKNVLLIKKCAHLTFLLSQSSGLQRKLPPLFPSPTVLCRGWCSTGTMAVLALVIILKQ
jgi:hypothetical protein